MGWDGDGERWYQEFNPADFERIDIFTLGPPRTLEPSDAQIVLGVAVRAGDASGVKAALAAGGDPDRMPDDVVSPLRVALWLGDSGSTFKPDYERVSRQQQLDVVAALLAGGAELDNPGEEPAVHAVLRRRERGDDQTTLNLLRLLVGYGADVEAHGTEYHVRGRTPLQAIVERHGGPALVKFLLASGADPTRTGRRKKTPLARARADLSTHQSASSPESMRKAKRLAGIVDALERHAAGTLDTADIDALAEADWRRWLADHEA